MGCPGAARLQAPLPLQPPVAYSTLGANTDCLKRALVAQQPGRPGAVGESIGQEATQTPGSSLLAALEPSLR